MKRKALGAAGVVALLAVGCGEDRKDSSLFDDSASMSGSGIDTGNDDQSHDDTDGPSTTSGGSSADSADSMPDDDSDDADDSGIKLDVGPGGDAGGGPCVGEGCEGCTYVDLLFVIDNSGSMGSYQQALGLAFPAFAQTLVDALPPGTNVHVGVTSTEMGYSSSGSTSVTNGMCTFIGENGQPNDAFYVTPDQTNTGRNGAQGRLYDPGGGQYYFDFDTDGGPAAITALEQWFQQAANIGEGGSNIEMLTAPVGWVADPANAATNAGFIRDKGAVLVLFFMQDEPDQTPMTIDGKPGGPAMLERIVAAKQQCGGTQCIIAGGFLNEQACSAQGNLPIDDLLAGLNEVHVQPLPNQIVAKNDPQGAAQEMNQLLGTTLAEVIATTCESIPPAG